MLTDDVTGWRNRRGNLHKEGLCLSWPSTAEYRMMKLRKKEGALPRGLVVSMRTIETLEAHRNDSGS